jgi:hypothetical protein
MITYRKKLLRIVETWDGEVAGVLEADLLRCFQQTQPLEGFFCREFFTILIDLTQDEDRLLANMKRDTRHETRRAAQEDLDYEIWDGPDEATINQFCDYFDQFAIQKHQPPLNRNWIGLLAASGALTLSRIKIVSQVYGEDLVWHAYHRGPRRVTLLHSASLFRANRNSSERNRVGRAHRYHHWRDMLEFKRRGISVYDLGGWYEGSEDQQRLSINKFKEEFGGTVVKNYICERALTRKAALFLRARSFLLGRAI